MQEEVRQDHNDSNSDSNDATDRKVADERETVVKDLLRVLRSISRVNMEPSSESFVRTPIFFMSDLSPYTALPTQFSVPLMDEAICGSQRDDITCNRQSLDTLLLGPRFYITNGIFQINKIRQVASTLISTPENRKGFVARKAEEYLPRKSSFFSKRSLFLSYTYQIYLGFLELIMQLEHVGSADVDSEEEDLRHWADIRELQMQFARSGGFLLQ